MVLIICTRHDRVCDRTTAPDGTIQIACADCTDEIAVDLAEPNEVRPA